MILGLLVMNAFRRCGNTGEEKPGIILFLVCVLIYLMKYNSVIRSLGAVHR